MAHVPHEAVHARLRRQLGEPPDLVASGVEERESCAFLRSLAQVVGDDRPFGRVVAGIEERALGAAPWGRGFFEGGGCAYGDPVVLARPHPERVELSEHSQRAEGRRGLEQVDRLAGRIVRQPVERRKVVEYPERPAVGRGHQVAVLDQQVVYGRHGQVPLEGLPRRAGVRRHVHARLGAGVQEARPRRVLPDYAHELAVGDPLSYGLPGAPAVARPVEVCGVVVELVVPRREPGRAGVVGGQVDHADGRPLGEARRGDVVPRRA